MVDFVRRAQAVVSEAAAIAGTRPRDLAEAMGRFFGSINIWFWGIVGLPTLLAGVYFFAIASDLYSSEVKFIVRGPNKVPTSAISAMLSASSAVSEDAYAVHEYVMSRDAVRRLEREVDLRGLLSRPEGDLITRFPGLWFWRKDFESLYWSYKRFVSVEADSLSGVTTLLIKGYRPEDAQRMARALLEFSEQLVNQLNERARQDSIGAFQREVDRIEQQIAKIQTELTAYRIRQKMLDPKSAAIGPLELLSQMIGQQTNARAQLAELVKNSPNSPQIPLMQTRIASLDKLIAEERGKITGDNNSVVTALTEYERLDVQKLLAEKTLVAVRASLEQAKLEAQRQQLYIETIAQPNLADYPLYPKRAVSFGTVVVSCLLAYGIAWLLIASVREHASA
ncbi:MAG: capsule biosynthesis protein [Alphaproteobacteria bacterium]|nr:MAG: capsule biosynthesis protein [Alphaproteobacteria bacterium]